MKNIIIILALVVTTSLMAQPPEFVHNNVCGGSPPPILYAQVSLDGTPLANGTWVAAFTEADQSIAGNIQVSDFQGNFPGTVALPVYRDDSNGTTCTVDAGVSNCPGSCEKFGVVVAVDDGLGGTCFYATISFVDYVVVPDPIFALDIIQGYGSQDFGSNQININTATTPCFNNIADAITALPVEFLSFTARRNNNTVQLDWATASESGNSHFEVERSLDGQVYENIGRVNGVGDTEELQQYQFVDRSPKAGANYYRLRQVDYDGQFDYSRIVIAQFGDQGGKEILAFPNPMQGEELTLTLNGDWDASTTSASLVDINGRTMASFTGLATGSTSLRLPNKLPAGIYQLIATDGVDQQTIRLVIQ